MFSRLKSITQRLKQEYEFYKLISRHPDTPWLPKLLLGLALGYLLLPFDLIPDFIPILGQLDDVVIIPLLIFFAMKLTPQKVIEECRQNIK
jgi:uncharacterized membrane protein YkvA (DUF1232 family)